MIWRIPREDGATRIELGRLWLIRWAPNRPSTPGHPNIPGHLNVWMIVWRRKTPEWAPQTNWIGSENFGRYWRGCEARLQRARGIDPEDARCRFPKCDCPPPSSDVIAELKARAKMKRSASGGYAKTFHERGPATAGVRSCANRPDFVG
jgi:hypothetical protein